MKKEEIINELKKITDIKIPAPALKEMTDAIDDYHDYQIERNGDIIIIHSDLKEGEHGSYIEIKYEYDRETRNSSVITCKKEYSPQNEVRYRFMQQVGFNIFTNLSSYVFTEDGLLIYKTWYSDENKYYGDDELPLDYSRESLLKYFEETSPTYEKGYYMASPKSAYNPFTTKWQRYGRTHVYKFHGRNPMNGEHGSLGITFDDKSLRDEAILSESYGQIYSYGRSMKLSSEEEIVGRIEELYQESMTESGFDMDHFRRSFDESMFESRGYH